MNLLSIGISHRSAPLEVRERMWLSPEETRNALRQLKERFFSECVMFSTCNRTEVYGTGPGALIDDAPLRRFMIGFKRATGAVDEKHFYGKIGGGAVHQLFKVASGIDSMVIGDIQILNQVKEGFQLARDLEAMGPVMHRLMQSTLHVGKRTRTETAICEGAVSVSYAAVELAGKIFADLSRRSVLLVGAGETGELTLKHLQGKGIHHVSVANRTREHAETLVAAMGGTVVDFDRVVDALLPVDIVITSVHSPAFVLEPEDVHQVMRQRQNNPLFIIDIGVPRNVNPAVRKIENVFLYDIDALSAIVDRNLARREEEIPKVTRIIREEMVAFFHWYNSLQVGPTIQELRESFESIRDEEVGKNINRFQPHDRELVEMLTRRIVNKILHRPTTALREGSGNGEAGQETLLRIHVLRQLFGISREGKPTDEE